MRYRNDSAVNVTVHLDPPVVLAPGEELEHDAHIVGLTAVPDEQPASEEPAPPAATTKSTKGKAADQ